VTLSMADTEPVRADDFFVLDNRSERVLNQGVLVDLIADSLPLAGDASVASGLLDLMQHELVAYGTDGSNELDDKALGLALRAIEAVIWRLLGMPLNLPFGNFTTFRSYWIREGASGHGAGCLGDGRASGQCGDRVGAVVGLAAVAPLGEHLGSIDLTRPWQRREDGAVGMLHTAPASASVLTIVHCAATASRLPGRAWRCDPGSRPGR